MPLIPRVVQVSQVVTEEELIKKSTELEQALEFGNFTGNISSHLFFLKNKCNNRLIAQQLINKAKLYIIYKIQV